ncbi:MAG: glycosyltransferase, partial [Thermoplasmata archaeon]|nr:glycosyltransferase [Thermoplasmata archaeon]
MIIPTLNCRESLRSLLGSLQPIPNATYEVLVVDGGSSDGTAALAQDSGARVFVEVGDRTAARNRGWREAHAEVVVFLDAD